MTVISEAFVGVRPDLSNFAKELRVLLPKEIAKVGVGSRTVTLVPGLSKGARAVVASEVAKWAPIRFEVTPVLAAGSAAAIRKQLGVIENVPIGVTLAGGQTAKVKKEVAAAAAAAGEVSAAATTGTGARNAEQARAINQAAVKAEAAAVLRATEIENAFRAVQLGVAADVLGAADAQKVAAEATRALGLETIKTNAAAEARIGTIKREASLLAEQTTVAAAAAGASRQAQLAAGSIAGASTGKTSETAQAQATLAAITKAEAAANEALEASILAEDKALIALNEELVRNIALQKEAAVAAEHRAATARAQLPAATAITNITSLVDSAKNPVGATAATQAAASQRNFARAVKESSVALEKFALAESGATKEQLAHIQALNAEAIAGQKSAAIQLEAAQAAQKSAQAQGAATRGALSAGASFLGVRGAVLASTLPFLAATVAVTTFSKAIKQAATLEQNLNVFQAVSGATATQLQEVSDKAIALGADLTLPATSANDAAEAMTELSKAGLSVNNTLDASKGVLQLAAAANISAADAAKITATQLNAFGLAGREATRVTDLLAGASIAAQGEISDFALAFQQSAAVAKQVGLSIETTTGALTELAKAGLKGSDAGTSLRTFLLRLAPTTKTAANAQKELGVVLDHNRTIGQQLPELIEQYRVALLKLDPIARQQVLTQIFGQDAIRAASIIFGQATGELDKVVAKVSEAGTGAQLAEARMKGLSGATEGLSSSAQTLGTTLGGALVPTLTSVVHTISDVTQVATDAAQALNDLGKVTVAPVVNFGGGTDVLAQAGLAIGAGLGIKALANRRKASQAAKAEAKQLAAAEVEAARAAELGWVAADTAIAKGAETAAAVQIREAEAAGAANVTAANSSAAAWGTAFGKQIAGTKKFLSANKLLIGGIGASIIGDKIGGQAGSAISTIGNTTALGAAAGGVPGAIVGAGLGILEAGINSGKEETRRNRAKWDALSYAEQQAVLRKLPSDAAAKVFLSVQGLTAKPNQFDGITGQIIAAIPTFAPDTLTPGGSVQATVGPDQSTVSLQPTFLSQFGNFLKARSSVVNQTAGEAVLAAADQRELNIALAKMSGSTEKLQVALEAQAKADRRLIASLQAKLVQPNADLSGFAFTLKERTAIAKQIGATVQDLNSTLSDLSSIANKPFELPTAITIAGIQAGATKGLEDDLANKQDVVGAIEKALKGHANKTQEDKDAIKSLQVQLAQANADVVTTARQIQDQNLSNAQALLRDAADKAGNIGAAENKYIAFLRAEVTKAGSTTAETIAAQEALNTELDKRKAALQAIIDSQINVRDARLNLQLQIAEATPGIKDNERILNEQIANDRKDIARIQKQIKSTHATGKALADLQLAILGEKSDIVSKQQAIKNLLGGGGFSLSDLFKEAVNEFNTFGSNIGATSRSILSGQDARGALGKNILNGTPEAQLTEAQRQTRLLAEILAKIGGSGTGGSPPLSGKGTSGNLLASYGTQIAAAYGYSSS